MQTSESKKSKGPSNLATIFGIFVSLIAAIITLQFGGGRSAIGTVILIGILVFITIFFLVSWPVSTVTKKFRWIETKLEGIELKLKKIDKIEKDLNALEDRLDINKEIMDLKFRMSLFEKRKMNKRGIIDPRWIIIIIILILLYLFLKEQGLF